MSLNTKGTMMPNWRSSIDGEPVDVFNPDEIPPELVDELLNGGSLKCPSNFFDPFPYNGGEELPHETLAAAFLYQAVERQPFKLNRPEPTPSNNAPGPPLSTAFSNLTSGIDPRKLGRPMPMPMPSNNASPTSSSPSPGLTWTISPSCSPISAHPAGSECMNISSLSIKETSSHRQRQVNDQNSKCNGCGTDADATNKQNAVGLSECAKPAGVEKKRFACTVPGCEKTLSRSPDVARHIKSKHSKEGDFPCPEEGCIFHTEKVFKRKDHLFQHMSTKHGGPKRQRRKVSSDKCPVNAEDADEEHLEDCFDPLAYDFTF